MFLNKLNKNEKSAFFSIALKMAEADGVTSDDESLLMNEYLNELNCTVNDLNILTIDDALAVFNNSSKRTKKCVYIELYSLSLCDELLSNEENELLFKIIKQFNISNDDVEAINDVLYDITEDYKRLGEIINE